MNFQRKHILVTIKSLLIGNYHSVHIIYMSYMISYSLAVELSKGYFGDDEPSFDLSIR